MAEANEYLERIYLPMWRSRHANADSILSEVETRTISPQSTLQFHGVTYALPETERFGRGDPVELERRPDGKTYLRAGGRRLPLEEACRREAPSEARPRRRVKARRGGSNRAWMQNFFKTPTPPLWRLLN